MKEKEACALLVRERIKCLFATVHRLTSYLEREREREREGRMEKRKERDEGITCKRDQSLNRQENWVELGTRNPYPGVHEPEVHK